MFTLPQILTGFYQTAELAEIASLKLPPSPNPPLLRETTWQAIASLRRVIADVQLVQNSVSRSARSLALNRALGELETILDTPDILPQAERNLIIKTAKKMARIFTTSHRKNRRYFDYSTCQYPLCNWRSSPRQSVCRPRGHH